MIIRRFKDDSRTSLDDDMAIFTNKAMYHIDMGYTGRNPVGVRKVLIIKRKPEQWFELKLHPWPFNHKKELGSAIEVYTVESNALELLIMHNLTPDEVITIGEAQGYHVF